MPSAMVNVPQKIYINQRDDTKKGFFLHQADVYSSEHIQLIHRIGVISGNSKTIANIIMRL